MRPLLISTVMAAGLLAVMQPASAATHKVTHQYARGYGAFGYASGDAYRVGAQPRLRRQEPSYMYIQDKGVKRSD